MNSIILRISKLKDYNCKASDEEFTAMFGSVLDDMNKGFRELEDQHA